MLIVITAVQAKDRSRSSFVSQRVAKEVLFHYPVRPAKIALFGALRAPSDAALLSHACLHKGSWAMFWVPALSHARVALETSSEPSDLQLLKVSGPAQLQGILAFLEHPASRLKDGSLSVFNADTKQRAFLVSSEKGACIRIQRPGKVAPELAWDRAWRSYWNQQDPLWLPPAAWFDEVPGHPLRTELLAQGRALEELRKAFPESSSFLSWLAAIHRLQLALRTRPAGLAGFQDEQLILTKRPPSSLPPDFADPTQAFAVATPKAPIKLTVQGPGAFELRARVTSAAKTPALTQTPKLQIHSSTRRFAHLDLLRPKANQDHPSVGPVSRHRFWLPKGEHKLAFEASGAAIRLSLRKAQSSPRFSALLANATPAQATRKATRALHKLQAQRPKLAASLAHLFSSWQASPPSPLAGLRGHDELCQSDRSWLCAHSALVLSRDARLKAAQLSPRLAKACTLMHQLQTKALEELAVQQRLAQLSDTLRSLGAIEPARACLGHKRPVVQAAYLKASLEQIAPDPSLRKDPWLASGIDWFTRAPSPLALKSAYLRRKKKHSRQALIRPDQAKDLAPLRWLAPLAPNSDAPPSKRTWTQVQPRKDYTISPLADLGSLAQVMRLLVRPAPSSTQSSYAKKLEISIDGQRHRLDLGHKQEIFHWIISPQDHEIKVEAPEGTQIYCDQPLGSTLDEREARFGQRQYWSIDPQQSPLRFESGKARSWVSMRLRVQVSNQPERRQTLPLSIRRSNGAPLRLWLHYDPTSVDPSVALDDFPNASFPIAIELGLLAAKTQLWLLPRKHAPKLALSLQRSELRAPNIQVSKKHSSGPKTERSLAAQGPKALEARIKRSQELYSSGLRGPLQDELEWIAHSKDPELLAQRDALLDLINSIEEGKRRSYFSFPDPQDPPKEPSPRIWRASFLDVRKSKPQVSIDELQRELQETAASLQVLSDASIAAALHSISRFFAQWHEEQRASSSDALIFGMLERITRRIQGSLLSAWKGRVARRTRWKTIEYASQSAGHEWLHLRGQEQKKPAPNAPWRDPAHTFSVSRHQQKVLQLRRNKPGRLKIQAYCQRTRPNAPLGASQLVVKVDRDQHHQVELGPNEIKQLELSIPRGPSKLKLSILHQQDQDCAFRVLEKHPANEDWTPIELDTKQRWFVAQKDEAVTFHAQGPGLVSFQVRSLDPSSPSPTFLVKAKGPKEATRVQKHIASSEPDPHAQLERSKETKSSQAVELSALMSQPGVYRYEIQSQGAQFLVRAQTRVAATPRPSKQRLTGLLDRLKARVSKDQTPAAIHRPSNPPWSAKSSQLRAQAQSPSLRGLWSINAGAGLLSDLENDQPKTRVSSQLQGTWLRAIDPKRMWFQARVGMDSEKRIVPALRSRARLFVANQKGWLRGDFGLQGASQYLHRFALSYGAFARLAVSSRALLNPRSDWDLLSELRFSYRGLSQNTLAISKSSIKDALHRHVYRGYVKDHPFSLRPRVEIRWRKFYDLRAYAGQDLWLNSDLASVDRSRSWFKVAGLIDPFKARSRIFWSYDTGYRLSFAPRDQHRSQGYWRHAWLLDLKANWRLSKYRRWELGLVSALYTQSRQATKLRILVSAGLVFDLGKSWHHRPIQHRRYPREFKTNDWNFEETQP